MNMNCDENQLVCTQMSTNLKKKKSRDCQLDYILIVQVQEDSLTLTDGSEGRLCKVIGVVQYLCAFFFFPTFICAQRAVLVAFMHHYVVTGQGYRNENDVPV